jgi:hypothetical protein
MASTTEPRVTRRGFRGRSAPDLTPEARERIEQLIATYAEYTAEAGGDRVLATVRYATYIGPGCAAEHGARVLELYGNAQGIHGLFAVYPDGSAS